MVRIALTHPLCNNLGLKITAFIIGYSMWALLSSNHTTQITYQVPIAFYNVPTSYCIAAPDKLKITIKGKRADLKKIAPEHVAFHGDASRFVLGDNYLVPSATSLFLPKNIELVDYTPTYFVVHVSSGIQAEKEMVQPA